MMTDMLCWLQMQEDSLEDSGDAAGSQEATAQGMDHHLTGNPFAAGNTPHATADQTSIQTSASFSSAASAARTASWRLDALPGVQWAISIFDLHHCTTEGDTATERVRLSCAR